MINQPPEAFTMFQKYSAQLNDWNKAYERFMSAKSHTFTSKQVRGAALLKIHHTAAWIMAACNPPVDDYRALAEALNCPTTFKKFTAEFQTIINLSRSLITTAEQDARNGKAPLTFSTDLGLIGPLYYTGVKCRIPAIREEAVALLKRCPRKEGMWDSAAAVNLVREFWELEERHNANQKGAPEENLMVVPLHEVVDLVFYDGGHWEWKMKDLSASSMADSLYGMNRVGRLGASAYDNWVDGLEEKSLFQGTFMLSRYAGAGAGSRSGSGSDSASPASSNMG